MTEAALELVLNNLKELVAHRSLLIGDNSGHIVRLLRDLLEINAFLKDSRTMERPTSEIVKEIVRQIHDVVYEVEDIIDVFMNKALAPNNSKIEIKNRKVSLSRKLLKILLNLHTDVGKKLGLHTAGETVDLHTVGKTVEEVRKRVQQAMGDTGIVKLKAEHKSQQSQDRLRRKKHVVGFEDMADDLINSLTRDSDFLLGISIIGMGGLGKTTLARKVYNDFRIIDKFPIRIWVSISHGFSERGIFLSILKELTTLTEEIESKANSEIADLVIAHLDKVSFLIVMDDVWDIDDWRRLKATLPENNKGKVLITSRHLEVGTYAGHSTMSYILTLDFFSDEESWKLLRLEALHALDCPPDLENVGRTIASNCMGWPFAVVIIGGILATKSKDPNAMKEKWEKVSMKVSSYLNVNNQRHHIGNIKKFISLSYYDLSYHLRSCFLYMGMFSEDYEIPASKLIRMWIGEGFIQHSESCSLEETAEQYLEELIRRNLVKSEKFKHDGKVKTCRIHDLIYQFCQYEAAKERLLKQIKYDSGIFTTSNNDMNEYRLYRGLSIHSNCKIFISSKPYCPHARSFVCFSEDKYVVSKQNSSNFFAAFKFLKVLDVEPFRFEEIGTDIYQLVYMRYLVLSSNLSVLRSEFSQLWNIQTLIIHTTSRTLEVQADIWKMSKLRYFKTNASANLPKPSKISTYGKELQRLGTISVESCTPEFFNSASNLKKLGIRGNLSLFFYESSGSLDSLGKMEHIEKLELINDVYPLPSSEKPLRGLLQHHQFPYGLMSLTLRATFLSWDAMSTLALLKKLKVLKLKENAVMGETWNWNADDGGFKCLQLLHIEDTDLINWNASSLCYPKLRNLVLRNCEKLLEIPNGIADIPSLQTLELYECRSAAASAKAIKEAKRKTQPEGSPFMLSIFPPIEY